LFFAAVSVFVLMNTQESIGQAKKSTTHRSTVKHYTIRAGKTIRVRLHGTIDSEHNRVGDSFTNTVVDPVYSSSGVELIPAGSIITGHITSVTRAAKDGQPGSIGVHFTNLRLPSGKTQSMSGSLASLNANGSVSDEEGHVNGKKTSNRNMKFIGGGAGGGAIIGAIAGGGKGALIGGAVGAVGGLIGKNVKKGREATIKDGTEFGVYLNYSVSLPAYRPK